MKNSATVSIVALAAFLAAGCGGGAVSQRPRVIVCTDINNAGGDPDDKQSMGHLLMHADELDIELLVADRWDGDGVNAALEAIAAYQSDFEDPRTGIKAPAYPAPDSLRGRLARTPGDACERFISAARVDDSRPLWILVWGNMVTVRDALFSAPDIADRIRLFTIGTNLRVHGEGADCRTINWNGPGRNDIYNDARFKDTWWVESDWTYAGMFIEPGPAALLDTIAQYGALGRYIHDVVQPFEWAHYFRVGDTPSVTYLLDPEHDPDDPAAPGWAGEYIRPFPDERPYYWTGIDGGWEWDYSDPCRTWGNAKKVEAARMATLHAQRQRMYHAYISKMRSLYR